MPPFPPVAARLLMLLSRESVQFPAVAELISSDPTFCAKLLQHVNSVQFGLPMPVTSVASALAMLGLDRTRALTVTLATAAYARTALQTPDLRRCWQHTLATAVVADEVARACEAYIDVAYTAGIMHDIGRLGLLIAYQNEYERTIRDAAERCMDLLDFERSTFGVDHAEAGRWLAERWKLPEEFRQVAGRHHDGPGGGELTLVDVVHVACRLADCLGYDVSRPLKPLSFAEILADLPECARGRLDEDVMREVVQAKIAALDSDAHEVDVAVEDSVRLEPDEFAFVLPPAPHHLPNARVSWPLMIVIAAVLTIVASVLWMR